MKQKKRVDYQALGARGFSWHPKTKVFRVSGCMFRVSGSACRVEGLGLRFEGSHAGVQGLLVSPSPKSEAFGFLKS